MNQPAAQALGNLANQNIIRGKDTNVATVDEEYLPVAAAFHLCGKPKFQEQARVSAAIVRKRTLIDRERAGKARMRLA